MSDLISRQDALKPFCIAPDGTRIPEFDCENFPVEFSVEFIKKHLLSLPSAEPKTKIGKWIAKSERYRWMRKCSVCGWMQEIDTPKMQGWVYRYCPNCGARMTKGGDDE